MSFELMDVTLRESIYIENNIITEEAAQQLVEGLSRANINYIEIGYISNNKKSKHLSSYCPDSYIKALSSKISPRSKSKLVVMLHPHEYNREILERLINSDIELVRLCISFDKLEMSILIIQQLKEYGIKVSANLIRVSELSIEEIIEFTNIVEHAGVEYIYLADSNGSMTPDIVKKIYKNIKEVSNLKMGFHPHNNINLASINSLEAIYQGASIIDCSIYGYGKGLVNLDTGYFVAMIDRMGLNNCINLKEIINISRISYDNFIKNTSEDLFMIRQQGILTGYNNINLDSIKKLKLELSTRDVEILDGLLEV